MKAEGPHPLRRSREHQIMQAGHVLHDQRVPADRVAVVTARRDPPHLHLADPVLGHHPATSHPPVLRLLVPGQLAPAWLAGWASSAPSRGRPCHPSAPRRAGATTRDRSYTFLSCVLPGTRFAHRRDPHQRGLAPGPGGLVRRTTTTWVLIVCRFFLPRSRTPAGPARGRRVGRSVASPRTARGCPRGPVSPAARGCGRSRPRAAATG